MPYVKLKIKMRMKNINIYVIKQSIPCFRFFFEKDTTAKTFEQSTKILVN